MEEYRLHRQILCIDLKSFYASVECAELGLDPFKTPLVVADVSRGKGSIVLAVRPYLRSKGMPSRCRIYEIPEGLPIRFQKPRMELYLEYSAKVVETYLEFVSEHDLYIYSIDEAFLDVTEYLNYYQLNAVELAKKILDTIYEKTKLFATCGIGPNMLIAKLALDIESKSAPNFIAIWNYQDIPTKLWPVTPLSKMWGIGINMERRLNQLGLYVIGDIASFDVTKLKKAFGILGEELYYHTHGIDMSLIQEKYKLKPASKSYGIGQTLFHDYYVPDIFQIIREMVDDVCSRMRIGRKQAKTISLGIGYSKEVMGGFYRQITLDQPTSSPTIVFQTCMRLFETFYEDQPIRRVNISVSHFVEPTLHQYSLFEDIDQLEKEQELFTTVDQIKERFGKNSVNRASSEFKSSTIKERNKLIGGHRA